MLQQKNNWVLLMIDYQQGFLEPIWGKRSCPHAEDNAARLVNHFRDQSLPIFHAQHLSKNPDSPLRPGQSGVEFIKAVAPAQGEKIFQKHVNSAFIGTTLEPVLRQAGIDTLIVCGIAVDRCVSTTVRMAANLGFNVFVAADASFTHERRSYDGRLFDAEAVHSVSLASLEGEFATCATTETIIKILESWS